MIARAAPRRHRPRRWIDTKGFGAGCHCGWRIHAPTREQCDQQINVHENSTQEGTDHGQV